MGFIVKLCAMKGSPLNPRRNDKYGVLYLQVTEKVGFLLIGVSELSTVGRSEMHLSKTHDGRLKFALPVTLVPRSG